MYEALFWGFVAAVSLLIGAIIALRFKMSHKIIGFVMAFGVGALISSVCFELVANAFLVSQDVWIISVGLMTGALMFFIGDALIDGFGGKDRKNMRNADKNGNSGLPILLGTILDGIPESIVIGLTAASGGSISIAIIIAVFLSNIPEAMSSSTGLLASGWKKRSIIGLWCVVVAMSAASAAIGYSLLAGVSGLMQPLILSFAGGAILIMLADTMMPESYRESGKVTGLIVTLGFCLAFTISILE